MSHGCTPPNNDTLVLLSQSAINTHAQVCARARLREASAPSFAFASAAQWSG